MRSLVANPCASASCPKARGAPRKQLTTRLRLQRVAKPRADGVVQRGVFDEVLLGALLFERKVEVGLWLYLDSAQFIGFTSDHVISSATSMKLLPLEVSVICEHQFLNLANSNYVSVCLKMIGREPDF